VALLCAGCPTTPVVKQQTFSASAGSLRVVGVVPFYPRPELRRSIESDASADEVANLVATFVADALMVEGVQVIPPSDLAVLFEAQGAPLPRRDPRAAAETAAREFGASSVVLGEVYRWRERGGGARGSDRPAGVGYELSLFDASTGRRLWSSRFDHTQRSLTADPLTARNYPGGGSRWLTAAELARWGAEASAESLVSGQWRDSK
jgi:hypothetical protein